MNFSTWSIKFLQKFSKLSSVKSTNNVVFSFWSARWILCFRFIVITWYCIQVIIFYQDNFTLKFSKKFMILLRNYCNLPTDQKGLRRDFDASFFFVKVATLSRDSTLIDFFSFLHQNLYVAIDIFQVPIVSCSKFLALGSKICVFSAIFHSIFW